MMFLDTDVCERSPTATKPKMLNFDDSGDEYGRSMMGEAHDSLRQQQSTCRRSGLRALRTPHQSNVPLCDSGIGSPTPRCSPRSYAIRSGFGLSSKSRIRNPESSAGSCMSPIPFLGSCDESDTDEHPNSMLAPPDTPPHRRMRSLRLYDTPHTPKSLLEKSQQQRRCGRSGGNSFLLSTTPVSSATTSSPLKDAGCGSASKTRRLTLDPYGPQANVNPFTACRKRGRQELDRSAGEESPVDDAEDRHSSLKRLALSEINTSRYVEEFHQVAKLGDGEFGSVYRCVNRLDGCIYAIKKSKMPVAGSVYERNALNEVYAHAVLGKHTHVVRYYSAWAEDDHMYIQNEFCNGGSLGDLLIEQRKTGLRLATSDLAQILMQVAQGLKYIHAQGLVHMDIKPANIFIHRESVEDADAANESGIDDEPISDDRTFATQKVVYKIGDLGHVTSVKSPIVEEGDCRYLPLEILHEEYDELPKADIFALALTVFEAGGEVELPKNGPMWHKIREEALPDISHVSVEFNGILRLMANINPKSRPTAASVVHHPVLCPFRRKSRAQLYRELNEEKLKNQLLKRELEFQKAGDEESSRHKLSSMVSKPIVGNGVRRLLGKSCARSTSLTVF